MTPVPARSRRRRRLVEMAVALSAVTILFAAGFQVATSGAQREGILHSPTSTIVAPTPNWLPAPGAKPRPRVADFPPKSSLASPRAAGEVPPAPGQRSYLSLRALGAVPVYQAPDGPEVRRLGARFQDRAPTTFLATGTQKGSDGTVWYEVLLPVKPNMSRGWVKAEHVEAREVTQAVLISLSRNQLDLYQAGSVVESFTVCVGAPQWPTPTGDFFVNMKLTNPGGAYGPYALGLSGYSNVLTDWPGGGQTGIHGTNNPSSIGRDVSHGCVRLRNAEILSFAPAVELGTPVFIRP